MNDPIIKNKLDFIHLTETWLNEHNNAAVLIETAPPNDRFTHEARAGRKGGGVVVLFNNVDQGNGKFDPFQHVALQLRFSSPAAIITIYRPLKYNAPFSDDFTSLLIVGDFKNDANANELLNILDSLGLAQDTTEPTHKKGHTLDLIISKGLQTSEGGLNQVAVSHKTVSCVSVCRSQQEGSC